MGELMVEIYSELAQRSGYVHFEKSNFLITGGAGFIGSAVVHFLIEETDHNVLNLDKLTYAGNIETLASVSGSSRLSICAG